VGEGGRGLGLSAGSRVVGIDQEMDASDAHGVLYPRFVG
jgi:hypothetical protein